MEFKALAYLPLVLACLLTSFTSAQTPAVNVTITADDTVLIPGQTTTVRVFAQVDSSIESSSVGISSWYVDLLNSNGIATVPDYDNLTMSSSDNFDPTWSSGTTDGLNRRGIYNNFLFFNPTAGMGSPVELLAVELTANQIGVTTLSVQAGTTVPSSADDFLVQPIEEGELQFIGGNYALASVMVRVITISEAINLGISKTAEGVELNFTPVAGYDHTVMFRDDLSLGDWAPLPGAPHNSGSVTDSTVALKRFYSVSVVE